MCLSSSPLLKSVIFYLLCLCVYICSFSMCLCVFVLNIQSYRHGCSPIRPSTFSRIITCLWCCSSSCVLGHSFFCSLDETGAIVQNFRHLRNNNPEPKPPLSIYRRMRKTRTVIVAVPVVLTKNIFFLNKLFFPKTFLLSQRLFVLVYAEYCCISYMHTHTNTQINVFYLNVDYKLKGGIM